MVAILPGSYDPVTLGHVDIIRRAAEEYSHVYVVAFINPDKHYCFTPDERVEMLKLAVSDIPNSTVDYSEGLVIDYMREHDIDLIVKGYRNDSDLAYEQRMAEWNLSHGGYETRLIKCREGYENISSSEVRRALDDGEPTDGLLPKSVREFIKNR